MRVVIFANGELAESTTVRDLVVQADLIIAADGGARHCLALNISPHVLIGDFDSLSSADMESLESNQLEIIQHPAHKDYTDLELALRLATERQAEEICILGALGARYDQTIANLLLPVEDEFSKIQIRIIHGPQEIHYIHAEQNVQIHGEIGDTLSLIPLIGDVHGVITSGLEYPLNRETLYSGTTRGISNVIINTPVRIQIHEGTLLCVHIRSGGGE